VLGVSAATSVVVLATSTLPVQRGSAAVKLRCVGARSCSGTLTIAVKRVTRRPGRGPTTRLLTIGRAAFTLTAGQSKSVALTLDASGRALLRAHTRLDALLTIRAPASGSARAVSKSVRLLTRTNSTQKSSS
jgi:hypothetical protein